VQRTDSAVRLNASRKSSKQTAAPSTQRCKTTEGTRALLLPPRDLIIRLIAAIPPPRVHLVRYFGVFSSHSKFRSEIIPKPPQESAAFKPSPASGDQLEFPKLNGGPMRWLEAAATEQAATSLLVKLGLATS